MLLRKTCIKDFVKNSHDRFTVQFSENLSLKYPSIIGKGEALLRNITENQSQ